MTAEELEIEQEKIDNEVKIIAEGLNAEAVYDGVISPEHYLLNPMKTSWVLREPHDSGGDYCYKEGIIDRLDRNDIGRNKYFDPMRYLEYSLKNNLVLYDDIPDSDKDVTVSKLLLQTAFTNINKIVGGASVNWDIFPNYVDKFSGLVKRQLTIANPKIIIASGTIEFFRKYDYLTNASVHNKSYKEYYVNEGKIILNCYHLGQRTISQENFCNDIINALKDAKLKGFLN
ncbi:MAG TPA: hypothetical protein VIK53_14670 [Verrucomicrobiae bacterium]